MHQRRPLGVSPRGKGKGVDDGPGVKKDVGLDLGETAALPPKSFGFIQEDRDIVIGVWPRLAASARAVKHPAREPRAIGLRERRPKAGKNRVVRDLSRHG